MRYFPLVFNKHKNEQKMNKYINKNESRKLQ